MPPASSRVRPAVVADVPVILQLVRELAEYEKALHEVDATLETRWRRVVASLGRDDAWLDLNL